VGDSSGGESTIATPTLDDLAEGVRDVVVGWRRHLHRNPEISFHEEQSA
jgi:amidohydrolase